MRIWSTFLSIGVVACGVVTPAVAQTNGFTAEYSGGSSSSCKTTYQIEGAEPATPGKYPVFIYLVGTWETYNNASAMAAVNGMANRGFVAATVQYPNNSFGTCATLGNRSRCIFDSSKASSALNQVCSRDQSDCTKGVVVGGFSQGSVLATLAKNYAGQVQAVYGMGDGVQYSAYDLSACMADGTRVLDSDHLRLVNGQEDDFLGPERKKVIAQTVQVSGLACDKGQTTCLRDNGSGWVIVLNSQVEDGRADHCYQRVGGCFSSENVLDAGWENGDDPWELNTNLDWLTSFTQP
jgi:predicted esterase